jgi:hypothetical protein
VARIAREKEFDGRLTARILDQALGYLRLIACEPGEAYAPSPLVDIGWHMFILYTREYASFCQSLAGCFIHHTPTDGADADPATYSIARTVAAMTVHGLTVDDELWNGTHGECGGSECYACAS